MTRIRFGNLKVDVLSDSSSVCCGTNVHIRRTSKSETNVGQGGVSGNLNMFRHNVFAIRTGRGSGRRG
jgi:hypothetical protein